MKKMLTATIISLLVFGIGASLFVPTIQASPAVMIPQYQLSPEILMPGDTAVLTLQVKNGETVATQTTASTSAGETTTTVHTLGVTLDNIWIVPAQSGGKQIRATTNYEDIGYLAAGATIEVNFKLLVDSNMSEGVYFPTAKIDVNGGTDVQYPLLMKVSNSSVDLLKTSVPSKISQGGTTEIIITAVNKRENAVDEVIITPQGDDVEFVPSSFFLGSLAAKTSEAVVFSIKPLGTGARNLTFDVNYKNGDNLHTNSLLVPVTVIQTLDVAPIITNFPISITKGGSGKISIEVYNAKTEKITGVLVTPICNTTVIPSQYFIGSMDPDDVFSASFDIYADTAAYGIQIIGFKVSFKQGNDYFETPLVSKTFSVVSGPGQSYQSSGSSTTSTSGSSGMPQTPSLVTCLTPIILIIVIIVVVVMLYMRWKKRRKA
ncbi:MAG TPA: hypothetical protein DSN98_02820 [Thermoplasmata archaeon]|jgi:hypothetical protein|nr:MAG TPA: hypothetical protein DSN98_02820 [Thermoplasmata archaeon]